MDEKEFIIFFLKGLIEQYPDVHVQYAMESSTEYHIVTIQPTDMLRDNKEFRKEVYKLWKTFEEAFPDSDILITEPKPSFDMSNILFDSDEAHLDQLLENIDVIMTSKLTLKEDITYKEPDNFWKGYDFGSINEFIVEQEYALAA